MATLETLVSFDGTDGNIPEGSLIADANGDLFGTTNSGGASNDGTVFEIAKTSTGYATTPTVLESFDGTDGQAPSGNLIADARGDLFGTTELGGTSNNGTIFELSPGPFGYMPSDLSFNGTDGSRPLGSLFADANGNLFGTTPVGGASNEGTVFELAKTATGYASTPTVLASFGGSNGFGPEGSLIADASGNLFGTTFRGGANGDGTIFELSPTLGGETLSQISFDGADGFNPTGNLIADASGDLFGTTEGGGAENGGTVFEIAKTAAGYAAAPTVLASFAQGAEPQGSLTVDANGDLFGTTRGEGPSGDGTVFEITDSGYVVCFLAGTTIATPEGGRAIETLRAGDLVLTDDGTECPVRWLGRQTIATRFADAFRVAPIRIRAGALTENLPVRDLLVSPDHALLVGGVFVQAGALVNGVSITREDAEMPERLVYFHVELADHALILAEGVPAETFIDNVDRLAFDNWDEHQSLGNATAPMVELPHARAKSHRQVPKSLRGRLMARGVDLYGRDMSAVA